MGSGGPGSSACATPGSSRRVIGGTSGSSDGRYQSFVNGKNPIWNQYGHDRMGWALSTFTPATP